MTVIDDAAVLIRRRLDELGAERITLERTWAALGGRRPPSAAHRTAATGGGANGKRGRRSGLTRKQELLAQVKANPKARTAEIAREIGISTNQVANLLSQLKREGVLTREARTGSWAVAA